MAYIDRQTLSHFSRLKTEVAGNVKCSLTVKLSLHSDGPSIFESTKPFLEFQANKQQICQNDASDMGVFWPESSQ